MFLLSYDVGTTGVKTCLFELRSERAEGISPLRLLDAAFKEYGLTILPGGGAEQDPEEWWQALAACGRELRAKHPQEMADIRGLSFCSQQQSVVLCDESGRAVRPSLSYMDQRSEELKRQRSGRGPKVAGVGLPLLLESLRQTGVVAASAKDPVWKYLWVKEHEPDAFRRAYKWLDVKEALIARMTGRFVMSRDSAFATLLMQKDPEKKRYAPALLKKLGVRPEHLPQIVDSAEVVGPLLPDAAAELSLPAGTPVIAGGGDSALIPVGAGCVQPGDSHVYMGTSGWLSTVTEKRLVDTRHLIASVVGVQSGLYNYFAELETAGKCLEWVKDHLALDEINIYLEKTDVAQSQSDKYTSLYDYLSEVIATAPPGAGGVLFAPWLHGNRCPFEDPLVRGAFFNLSLQTGKTELLRAVVEGICYHMRWFLETIEKKLPVPGSLRFVGGGALSPVTAQILADILNREIETVASPQNVGAVGAAWLVAAALGEIPDLRSVRPLIPPAARYLPRQDARGPYERSYKAYQELYHSSKRIFHLLNDEQEI